MTFTEYQKLAFKTCKVYDDPNMNLLHMAIGLHSEYEELGDALARNDAVNISEELADHMWYIACYCQFEYLPFSYIASLNTDLVPDHLAVLTARFLDIVKKKAIYGNRSPALSHDETIALSNIIGKLFTIAYAFDISIEKSLENNIQKLKVRYPEKYSDISATNRDLDSEYEQLKK